MRASDADRERAADALRSNHADGRITTEELEQRTGRAYAATTVEDLDHLFDDLPRWRSPERARRRARPMWPPVPFVVPVIAVAIAVVASAHALWFAWPLMFFFWFRFLGRGWWWRSVRR